MTTKEVKLMIIENYIDWVYSSDRIRTLLKIEAEKYVDNDHVDEIKQAFNNINL